MRVLHFDECLPPVAVNQLPSAQAIVVLAGDAPAGAGRTFPDLNSAADRVWHGARLFSRREGAGGAL